MNYLVGITLWMCAAQLAAQQPAARPQPPTRDPNTPGYVSAKALADGAIPSAKENGNNFILGPTHNASPDMSVKDEVPRGQVFEFTMESKDSQIYPGIARTGQAQPDPAIDAPPPPPHPTPALSRA